MEKWQCALEGLEMTMKQKGTKEPVFTFENVVKVGKRGDDDNSPFPFSFQLKEALVNEIVRTALAQGHEKLVPYVSDTTQLELFAAKCLAEIENLYNAPDILKDPPCDIDAVWIISAPGKLLTEGSKPNWSANYSWLDGCERKVVGKAINLVIETTAKRLGKAAAEVTKEDISAHGPFLIYNGPDYESEDVATLLNSPDSRIAPEKAHVFTEVQDEDGTVRMIRNTADQAKSIHIPGGMFPRKIAICVLAAQSVRFSRLLAKAQTLSSNTEVVIVPIRSPKGHEGDHAVMEVRGALVNAFVNGNGNQKGVEYSF